MAAVLHLTGDAADVDELVRLSPIQACNVFRKGVPRSTRPNARPAVTSGISLVASDADFDFLEAQQEQVLQFLLQFRQPLAAMRAVQGVTGGCIDFGISMRNVIVQTDSFKPELLAAISQLHLSLVLSQYPTAGKDKRIRQYRRALRSAA